MVVVLRLKPVCAQSIGAFALKASGDDGQYPPAQAGLRAINWRLCFEATTNFVYVGHFIIYL